MPQPCVTPPCSAIQEAIKTLPELRPFPETATRLLAACQSDDSSSWTIAEIVKHDPGIAVRLLRIANSSMYGQAGRIRTIEQAVVVLGFRCVRDLAVAMAGQDLMNSGKTSSQERRNLWKHSLACAVIGRSLATMTTAVRPEEAFLAGIFHDIGKLLFYDVVPDEYEHATAELCFADALESENRVFGLTHECVGVSCAEQWGLAPTVRTAIGFHHRPDCARRDESLATLTAVANVLTRVWELGTTGETPPAAFPDWVSQLGIDDAGLEIMADQVAGEFAEALELCALS